MTTKLKRSNLNFNQRIIGFEDLQYFALEEMEYESPYYLLKSEEQDGIEFVVVSPFTVYSDYEFQLSEDLLQQLEVTEPEDVLVLSLITLQKPFVNSTINLLAPLVVNINKGIGMQLILNEFKYPVNAPLFSNQNGGD